MTNLLLLLLHQQMDIILHHPFIFFTLLSPIFIFFITKPFLHKLHAKKHNFPPSPKKLPILGNLHQFGSLPHRNLRSLSQKHGELMLLKLGKVPTLIVSSASAAQEIMKTHDLNFVNRLDWSVGRRLLYDNKDVSFAPYGEYWRQLKSICVLQLLSNKRVRSFHYIRKEETTLLMKRVRQCSVMGLPVDLSEVFTSITNDVACRSAFGRTYSEGQNGKKFLKLLSEFLVLLGSVSIGDLIPWLSWISYVNGFDSRVENVTKELDEFFEVVIEERLKNGVENGGGNFLDILLGIYRDNGTGVSIDRDSIKAIILDVFSAGTDTTATVLEWAMTELLRHPIIMKKLQNEVREILKDKNEITDNDLEKMHYLKAVIKETLRYHTPIPLLVPRTTSKDVKIKEYDVLSGTMVITNAWAIGRDPSYWAEPEEFRPDRFLNSSIDYKGLNFELIPFGSGRRICPGIAFAMATNEYVLANLVGKFDWKLPNEIEGKDLDISERPGVAVRRAVPLLAVPIASGVGEFEN